MTHVTFLQDYHESKGNMNTLFAPSWAMISHAPTATKSQITMTRPAAKTRSCQIDCFRMTAAHFESGLCGAGSPMSAAARMPRRWRETRHTTVSACEATAEVWRLLHDREVEDSGWDGRGGWQERSDTAARGRVTSFLAC
jgi:hypothetical protein